MPPSLLCDISASDGATVRVGGSRFPIGTKALLGPTSAETLLAAGLRSTTTTPSHPIHRDSTPRTSASEPPSSSKPPATPTAAPCPAPQWLPKRTRGAPTSVRRPLSARHCNRITSRGPWACLAPVTCLSNSAQSCPTPSRQRTSRMETWAVGRPLRTPAGCSDHLFSSSRHNGHHAANGCGTSRFHFLRCTADIVS